MRRRLAEYGLFFREFLTNHYTTGAVLPSGPFLANALARFVAERDSAPRRILEVGPGTGAVTRRIVELMGPQDRLDVVELNDRFVAQLQRRFENEPKFRDVADRARVIHGRIEELAADEAYDLIVSGLPLNNFPSDDVQQLLAVMLGLLAPDGTLSFFQYVAMRRMKGLVSGRAERRRLRDVGRVMDDALEDHEIRRDRIWVNVPPAWVHHLSTRRSIPV